MRLGTQTMDQARFHAREGEGLKMPCGHTRKASHDGVASDDIQARRLHANGRREAPRQRRRHTDGHRQFPQIRDLGFFSGLCVLCLYGIPATEKRTEYSTSVTRTKYVLYLYNNTADPHIREDLPVQAQRRNLELRAQNEVVRRARGGSPPPQPL